MRFVVDIMRDQTSRRRTTQRQINSRWSALLLCLGYCCYVNGLSIHTRSRISRERTRLSMASVSVNLQGSSEEPQRRPKPKQQSHRHHHHHHYSPNINNESWHRRKIKSMFIKAKNMERHGQWPESGQLYREILKLDPKDAHSHLALAKLEARRNSGRARQVFSHGTNSCPKSIHLWQAWALYEESCGNIARAKELFAKALQLDPCNPYVCHACGLMERKLGNESLSKELWERALQRTSTAALVCSLGELLIANREYTDARELYTEHLLQLKTERERTEVYLAAAWLEEKYIRKVARAEELLKLALLESPGDSRAHVALARLEGRKKSSSTEASVRRLANACISLENVATTAESTDGRLYNAWAHLEVTSRRYQAARKILRKGMEKFPHDQSVRILLLSCDQNSVCDIMYSYYLNLYSCFKQQGRSKRG